MLSERQLAARVAEEVAGAALRLGPGLPGAVADRLAPQVGQEGEVLVLAAEQVSPAGDATVADAATARAASATRRVVTVLRPSPGGDPPRLVAECDGPAVARGVVGRVVTELAVLEVCPEGLVIRELAPKVSAREVQRRSAAPLLAGPDLQPIEVSDE